MTIRFTHPLDEKQFSAIAEQIGVQKKILQKRNTLSNVVSLSAILLFSLNLTILLVSFAFGGRAMNAESVAVAEKLAEIPVIGSIIHWCFENILLQLKSVNAIVRTVMFGIAVPVLVAIILRIVGELIIRNSTSASAGTSDPEIDQCITVERLKSDLSDLGIFAGKIWGVNPAKTCSLFISLLFVGLLIFGVVTEGLINEMDIGAIAAGSFIGIPILVVVLFLILLCVIHLFMFFLRPVYLVKWDNHALHSELDAYENKQREAQKAEERKRFEAQKAEERKRFEEEQKRLEAMDTDELYKMAYELPLWDKKGVQIMRILASRGDQRGKNYLIEYEYHLKEEREEEMMQYFREGRDQEERGNDSRARSLYKMAADMGHPDGMYNYARLCYKCGSVSEAKRYLRMCIDGGHYVDEHTRDLLRAMESGQNINLT